MSRKLIFLCVICIVLNTFSFSSSGQTAQALGMVNIAPPCEFRFHHDLVNQDKEHGNAYNHAGAIDLGVGTPIANDRVKTYQRCNNKTMLASISGKLTVGAGFAPYTVYITNETQNIRVVYGHLASYDASLVNQNVSEGDAIGTMGTAFGFLHLHMQVHRCGDAACSDYHVDDELQHHEWQFNTDTPYLSPSAMVFAHQNDSSATEIEVRESPDNATTDNMVPWRTVGQVVDGPVEASFAGQTHTWWKVDWGDRAISDGWVVEKHLAKVPSLFPDVPQSNLFFYHIHLLKLADIINGFSDGDFEPLTSVTRAGMAKFIANSLIATGRYPSVSACISQNPTNDFPDVSNDPDDPDYSVFYDYIMCLKGLGVINGFSDGTYQPNEPVRRAGMAKFIANSMVEANIIPSISTCVAQNPATDFSDVSNDPDDPNYSVFYDYIMCLKGLGIINGFSDGSYQPGEEITRDALSKFVTNTDNSLLAHASTYPTFDVQADSAGSLLSALDGTEVTGFYVSNETTEARPQLAIADEAQAIKRLWVASENGSFYLHDNGRLPMAVFDADILDVPTTAIDGWHNELWVGNALGAHWFNGIAWQSFSTQDGLLNEAVVDLSITPSGNVWVATADGLSVFNGLTWRSFSNADGLPNSSFVSIAAGLNDKVWGVTLDGKFGYFDGTDWHQIVNALAYQVDSIDVYWDTVALATERGLILYEEGAFSSILEPKFDLKRVSYDSFGQLWVLLQSGNVEVVYSEPAGVESAYLPMVQNN